LAERRRFGEYPFVAVAALVGALTVGLIVLGLELHWGLFSYVLVVIPVSIAAVYLVSYARIVPPPTAETPPPPVTATPSPPSPRGVTGDEEPFIDPVEEADRIASGESLPPPPPD
jgi:hypothetical protein